MMNIDFFGLPTRRIGNQHLRLDFLTKAGPRVVRLMLRDSDRNLLAETPDVSWSNPFGQYHLRGGHRLTHAPESVRSYVPDDEGVMVEMTPQGGARLLGPSETPTGLRKSVVIHFDGDRPKVQLVHALYNTGDEPIDLAPWAITQLPLGGIAVMPVRVAADAAGLQPDRHIVMWPYTRWNDARVSVADDYVFVAARMQSAAMMVAGATMKIGALNHGWIGYLHDGVFFVKRFDPQIDQLHPDRNCNVEVYCNDRCIELESLAPLRRLMPGETVEHLETWEVYGGLEAPTTMAGVRTVIAALGLQ